MKSLPKTKIQPIGKPKIIRVKGDPTSKGKSESQIEKEIISWLTASNIVFWPIKIKGDPTLTRNGIRFKKNKNRGFSDIHVCHNGRAIYLEVKKCGGECSQDQLDTQMRVRSQGRGIYEFVTSVQEAKNAIFGENFMEAS